MMTLCDDDQRNLDMLAAAFGNRDIALIECQVIATGETVPVICAVNRHPGGRMDLVPFAELFRGDQYEQNEAEQCSTVATPAANTKRLQGNTSNGRSGSPNRWA